MMNTRVLLFIALSAVALASCNKEPGVVCANDEIVVYPTLEETKATLLPAGNLTDSRIHIDGYFTGTQTKHLAANILYENNAWVYYTDKIKGVHYYWPQNSKLDFMAYCPANLENTFITIKTSKTVECKNLPLADSLQKGTLLKEFVCGYVSGKSSSDGAVTMTLKRPCATINFYLDEAVRSTLNYIQIEGLYDTGTYDASAGTWSSLSNKSILYCKVGKRYPDQINNASHLGGPYVVIPQSMRVGASDEVKLVFSYKSVGNSKPTITQTTIGKAKPDGGTEAVALWEPGKVYNYWVSLNGAANEVRMTVKVGEWSIQGTSDIDVK